MTCNHARWVAGWPRPARAPRSASGSSLAVGATGTFAYWTDDVTITGTTFTAGTLDLQVNDAEPSYATRR